MHALLLLMATASINGELDVIHVNCATALRSTSQDKQCMLKLASPFNTEKVLKMKECDNRSLCALVDLRAWGPRVGKIGSSKGMLTVDGGNFTFHVQDAAMNIYSASGTLKMWTSWNAPVVGTQQSGGRRLSWSSRFNGSPRNGFRSDCLKEDCPKRWENCWRASPSVDILQVSVLIFLERTFCDNFSTTDVGLCIDYVRGLFKDTNMVYEPQLGIHLDLAYIITPDVIEANFPDIANAGGKSGEEYLDAVLANYAFRDRASNKCVTRPKFKELTGYDYTQFGIAHVLTGQNLKSSRSVGSGKTLQGYALKSKLCTCEAIGWTRYVGDSLSQRTWVAFAHEIGHNFGATHYWKLLGSPLCQSSDAAGIMGCSGGKVNGVYAFSDIHKPMMCHRLDLLAQDLSDYPGCFRPYFAGQALDYSFGPAYGILVLLLVTISFCLMVALGVIFVISRQRKTDKHRYDDLRVRVKISEAASERASYLSDRMSSVSPVARDAGFSRSRLDDESPTSARHTPRFLGNKTNPHADTLPTNLTPKLDHKVLSLEHTENSVTCPKAQTLTESRASSQGKSPRIVRSLLSSMLNFGSNPSSPSNLSPQDRTPFHISVHTPEELSRAN